MASVTGMIPFLAISDGRPHGVGVVAAWASLWYALLNHMTQCSIVSEMWNRETGRGRDRTRRATAAGRPGGHLHDRGRKSNAD